MISHNSFVSIVLPTYNRASLIQRSIDSILQQTFTNFELIVVDDGSIDLTSRIIKNIKDSRIKYIKFNTRKGANHARNIGIKVAKGDYIAFQDSDDIWYPDKLRIQVICMQSSPPHVGIIYSAFWKIENHTKTYISSKIKSIDKTHTFITLLNENFITTPTLLIKKECFKKVGLFDETLPRFQDWDLVIRLSKIYDFNYIDEATINSYIQPDSISKDQIKQLISLEIIVKKYLKDFKKHKKILISHYETLAMGFYFEGNIQKAKYYLKKAHALDLLNFKLYLKYIVINYFKITYYLKLKKFYQIMMSK